MNKITKKQLEEIGKEIIKLIEKNKSLHCYEFKTTGKSYFYKYNNDTQNFGSIGNEYFGKFDGEFEIDNNSYNNLNFLYEDGSLEIYNENRYKIETLVLI